MDRTPVPGELYKHFKNQIYQIITIAEHSETGEQLVIYQAMYGDFRIYARPLSMFLSEADPVKHPQAETPDRQPEDTGGIDQVQEPAQHERPRVQSPAASRRAFRQNTPEDTESDYYKKRSRQIAEREQRRELFRRPQRHESATDELRANPNLLKFLDADTYEAKYRVLNEIQDELTDRLVDDIAVVLDVVIPEGPLTDRFYQLKNILLTRQKYEKNRFR